MTDGPEADPEAYEQACLAETREHLTRVTSHEREPYELRDVRVEGRYPNTRIVVNLWDPRYEKEVTRDYAIWREPSLFAGANGVREPPEQVGMLVTTWSLGG